MLQQPPKQGDVLVYRKSKHSTRPGPRAKDVQPASKGDDYSYYVEKFWIVTDIHDDGTLRLKTREGKTHEISTNDPNLRAVNFWDRLWFRRRFPHLDHRAELCHQVQPK
jgi:hypothetical protein